MPTCLEINKVNEPESTCVSRADSVRRWSTEGARAFGCLPGNSIHVSTRSNSILCRRSWFGGSRGCAGYTPKGVKMVLANQSMAYHCSIALGVIQHYKARFERILVKRACQLLSKIGSGDDILTWISPDGSKNNWTPRQILTELIQSSNPAKNQVNSWYASDIFPIDFIGGPPDKWYTYRGSLLTLLLDRIAVVALFEGIEALDGVIDPNESYTRFA